MAYITGIYMDEGGDRMIVGDGGEIDIHEGGLLKFNGRAVMQPIGQIYYVDPANGDDDNAGTSKDEALATMDAAIGKCSDWNGDLIVRLPGTETVTAPVEFDVKGVTVITTALLNPYANGEKFMTYGSHTDGPAATILQPTRMFGLGFCGSQAAGASLEFDCDEEGSWPGGFSQVENCRFSHWGIAKAYAVLIKGTGDNMIRGCMFDGYLAGYTQAAIGLQDSGDMGVWALRILENEFINIGSGKYCLQLASGCHFVRGIVKGNINVGSAKFFNANSQNGSAVFCDNYTGGATDTDSYNDSVDNLQTAGYKFMNNHYSE